MGSTVANLSFTERKTAMQLAKDAVEIAVKQSKKLEPNIDQLSDIFKIKSGAFVTAFIIENGKEKLRGCVGVPKPIYPLAESICDSSFKTVTSDPRFSPVTTKELPNLILELEVLTPFQRIEFDTIESLYSQIHVGEDGLMLKTKHSAGLLLPTVASKRNWTSKEYLDALAMKTFTGSHAYLENTTELYKFQALVIHEKEFY